MAHASSSRLLTALASYGRKVAETRLARAAERLDRAAHVPPYHPKRSEMEAEAADDVEQSQRLAAAADECGSMAERLGVRA